MVGKTLALLRTAAWAGLLYAVAQPWSSLGGLVDERFRWWEWFVVWILPAVGFALAGLVRDLVPQASIRRLLYPALGPAGLAITLLAWLGQRELVGIVVTAWLAYSAGVDVAWNVAPWFRRAPDDEHADAGGTAPWLPPWDRP